MTRILLIIIIVFLSVNKFYSQQIEVLTLGVFHFDFPNLDAVQTSAKDQIGRASCRERVLRLV